MSLDQETLDLYLKKHPEGLSYPAEQLSYDLLSLGAIKFGEFKLAYHEDNPEAPLSPVYIDLRVIKRLPEMKERALNLYSGLLYGLKFNLLADVPHAASPLVSSLADRFGIGMITPRISSKTHGANELVEGLLPHDFGKQAVLIDDLLTKATSKLKAIAVLNKAGINILDIVVLIDREEGGRKELEKRGYWVHSAMKLGQMMDYYLRNDLVDLKTYQKVKEYIKNS